MQGSAVEPFTDTGTVFISDVIGLARTAEGLEPAEIAGILRHHLELVEHAIEKHAGTVLQFAGASVLAFWRSSDTRPNHAQLAFDAARDVLAGVEHASRKGLACSAVVVLGTGEMSGEYFGPIKQFQIVGMAMAVADRLSRIRFMGGSAVYMSQYTVGLLEDLNGMEETETVARDRLEPLKVYRYALG